MIKIFKNLELILFHTIKEYQYLVLYAGLTPRSICCKKLYNVLLFAIVLIVRLLKNMFCHFALVTAMGQKKQVVLTLHNNHGQRTVSWYLLKVLKGLEAFC